MECIAFEPRQKTVEMGHFQYPGGRIRSKKGQISNTDNLVVNYIRITIRNCMLATYPWVLYNKTDFYTILSATDQV